MAEPELWDVLDRDGLPTGATHPRDSATWPQGGFHLVATIWAVRNDGRVLLTRRAEAKEFGGMWEFPGGSALAGESSRQAAVRELREETGLRIDADRLVPIGRFIEETALVDLFLATGCEHGELRPDPREVADAEWVELDEVDARRRSGAFAGPWRARLSASWAPLREAATGGAGSSRRR